MRGDQGVPGTTGPTGATGARGPTGRRGPAGPSVSRDQMLAAVGSQFAEINKRLETQLTRIAQLQQEIDLTAENCRAFDLRWAKSMTSCKL